jgi:hypothetical protein
VVRFDGVANLLAGSGTLLGAQPNTIFVVCKQTTKTVACIPVYSTGVQIVFLDNNGFFNLYAGVTGTDNVDFSGGFHVFTGVFITSLGYGWVDSNFRINGVSVGGNGLIQFQMMWNNAAVFYAGDVAEILVYDSNVNATPANRLNVENYLKTKYGIP